MQLLERLKKRKIVQWTLAYLAGAWVTLEVFSTFQEGLGWSQRLFPVLVAVLAVGLALTLVVAWYHGERGRQRVTGTELLIIGGILLAAGVTVPLLLRSGTDASEGTAEATPVEPTGLAVLPLRNMTGDPAQEYVADGMTDALITDLGRIKGLDRVISHTSVLRFKESGSTLQEIGRTLGVAAIIEGSIRGYGERVQIGVRLIDPQTEELIWEQDFVRDVGDVLVLQNEVSRAIASAIEVQLTPSEEARLRSAASIRPDVYDLYLRGLQLRAVNTVPARDQRIDFFERAIALDSTLATAHASLSIEYALAGGFNQRRGAELTAERMARRALALDPDLSEAHTAIALLHQLVDYDWPAAEEAFREAIEVNPGDAYAHHELAQFLSRMGRSEEALTIERRALFLDPLSPRYQSGIGEMLFYAGRFEEALVELEKTLELNPEAPINNWMVFTNWALDRRDEALRWCALPDGRPLDAAWFCQPLLRPRDEMIPLVEGWVEGALSGELSGSRIWLAIRVYGLLGETDRVMELLELAYEERIGLLVYIKVSPLLYPLHDNPRYQALLQQMNLD